MSDISADPFLLRNLVRQRKAVWTLLGLLVFCSWLGYSLFLAPQTFTAQVSVSMQQSTSSSPLQNILPIGNTGNKKYAGVLKSHAFAEKVEEKVGIQKLYHLPTPEDAYDKIMKSVKVDDTATDGLIYVIITLDGPSRMSSDAALRAGVKKAVADMANAYYRELQDFIIKLDTDKDSVLLRQANNEVRRARDHYNNVVANMAAFISRRRIKSGPEAGVATPVLTSGGTSQTSQGEPLTAAGQLQALYLRRGEVESKIKSADAMRAATEKMVSKPTKEISDFPSEDPLLYEVRRNVTYYQGQLDRLRVQYGEASPRVVAAREQLKIEEARLQKQIQSILKGNSSDSLKRQALQAEYEAVNRQIADAEANLQVGREMGAELERRKNEITLSLEALKTAVTQDTTLRLSTVSAQNRMTLIDKARPPLYGKPGMMMMAAISLLLAVVAVLLCFGVEYALRTMQTPAPSAAWIVAPAARIDNEADLAPATNGSNGARRRNRTRSGQGTERDEPARKE